jgi:hypothetical protein
MPWYPITHSCGHEQRLRLEGGRRGQWKADKEAENPCPDCLQKEREKANAASAAEAAALGLPALQGSERQVAWATTLRSETLAMIDDGMREFLAGAVGDQADAVVDAVRATLLAETDAGRWIELRGMTPMYAASAFDPMPVLRALGQVPTADAPGVHTIARIHYTFGYDQHQFSNRFQAAACSCGWHTTADRARREVDEHVRGLSEDDLTATRTAHPAGEHTCLGEIKTTCTTRRHLNHLEEK